MRKLVLVTILTVATVCGCSHGRSPEEPWHVNYAAGSAALARKDFPTAQDLLRKALTEVDVGNAPSYRRAQTLSQLALVYLAENNSVEAKQILNRASSEYEKLYKLNTPEGSREREVELALATTRLQLANLARDNLHFDEAENLYRKAMILQGDIDGSDDLRRNIIEGRAGLLKMSGRPNEALILLSKIDETKTGDESANFDQSSTHAVASTATSMTGAESTRALSGGGANIKDDALTASCLKEALRLAEKTKDVHKQAVLLRKMALAKDAEKDFDREAVLLKQAIALVPASNSAETGLRTQILIDLGKLMDERNQLREAEDMLKQAVANAESIDSPRQRALRDGSAALADVYIKEERYADALKLVNRNLLLEAKYFGSSSEKLVESYLMQAKIYSKQKNSGAAKASFEKAINISTKNEDFDPHRLLVSLDAYSKFLRANNEKSSADAVDLKAANVRSQYD